MEHLVTKHDLDKQVAAKLGMDYDKVKANSDYIVKRLRKMMRDEDTFCIKLSHLGYMYASQPIIKREFNKKSQYGVKEWLGRKLEKFEEFKKEGILSKNLIKRIKSVPRNFKKTYRGHKSFKELQEIQNNARG